jgi:hypothetical protein
LRVPPYWGAGRHEEFQIPCRIIHVRHHGGS